MKTMTLSSRDRRALKLGAFVGVPVLMIWGLLIPGGRALYRARHDAAQAQADLQRDRSTVANIHVVDTERVQTARWLSHEQRRLFNGRDEVEATGALTRYVERAAGNAGVKLEHVETRPTVPVIGSLHAVELSAHVTGTVPAVMTFLSGLEQGDRLVRLGRLIITHAGNGLSKGATQLSATADLYGYMLSPPADSTALHASGVAYVPLNRNATPDDDDPPDVGDAISHDPFSPDRGKSAMASTRRPAPPPPPPPPVVALVGTVIGSNGAVLAVCQVNSGPSTIVHVGQQIAGYTVRTIQTRAATLTDSTGHEIHLSIIPPKA